MVIMQDMVFGFRGLERRRVIHTTHTLKVDVTLPFAPFSTKRVLVEVFSREYIK